MNRKELERYIAESCHAEAEAPWAKNPDHIVFRHSGNRKWFALTLNIPGEKLGLKDRGMVDIVNLKCDPIIAGSFRNETGIFPAYHMNKERWISVVLDGSVEDETIKMLLAMSFDLTVSAGGKKKREEMK